MTSLQPHKLTGTVTAPSSKSDAQRLLLMASLANCNSTIENIGESDDVHSMIAMVQALGARVTGNAQKVKIEPIQIFPKKAQIHAGESGLGFRLMASLLACMGGEFSLGGKGTLLKRPMYFMEDHFAPNGVFIDSVFPPIEMEGSLNAEVLDLDASSGSQFISGLLVGAPLLKTGLKLNLQNATSTPYLHMTLQRMSDFGIQYTNANFERIEVPGNQNYSGGEYRTESDWSAASYWLLAGALGHDVVVRGLSLSSLQADKRCLDAFLSAGCKLERLSDGIRVQNHPLRPFSFDSTNSPDLFPTLAVLAATIEGVTELMGLNRLATKESDRGEALKMELEKTGAKVELDYERDIMRIFGSSHLRGAHFESHHDHRMAMSMAVLSTKLKGNSTISNSECVAKSYPEFWKDLAALNSEKS